MYERTTRHTSDEGDERSSSHDTHSLATRRLVPRVVSSVGEGTGLLHSSTELLVLSICDVVFISAFNISLLSDRESTDKMAEYHARSMVSEEMRRTEQRAQSRTWPPTHHVGLHRRPRLFLHFLLSSSFQGWLRPSGSSSEYATFASEDRSKFGAR